MLFLLQASHPVFPAVPAASSWWSPLPPWGPSERPGASPCCHPTSGRSGLLLPGGGPASRQLLSVPVALSYARSPQLCGHRCRPGVSGGGVGVGSG